MKTKAMPSSWIHRQGLRLDCGPYMSGALEAKMLLERLSVPKEPLKSVTEGHDGGIFNGPQFSRRWVDSPEYGVPFVGSSSMLLADLSNLPLLRKKDAYSSRLSYLKLEAGMTLISCSGTIGRMVYVRPDMDGVWSSQHVMKVAPDRSKILPGYLYAYLSSKFGVPQIVGGTYGAIIQHIEPQHIADLPVPRPGGEVEIEAHRLVERATQLRVEASAVRQKVLTELTRAVDWTNRVQRSLWSTACSNNVHRRLDAFHHSPAVVAARQALSSHSASTRLAGAVEEVFEPGRGPRLKVEDSAYGLPFLSSSAVFRLEPTAEYLISRRRTPNVERLVVTEKDLLVPRSGQLGGIIGHAVLPLPSYLGSAASEHLVRVRCKSRADAYYLWAVFGTQPGYLAAIGTAYGSSIPSLDCELLGELRVPWINGPQQTGIVSAVSDLVGKLSQAIEAERRGIQVVEQAIEEAA